MASPAGQVTIARPQRGSSTNGVLQVPATSTATGTQKSSPKTGSSRTAGPRLKAVIRRLPPGLTETELEEALGDSWKLGGDRVDWAAYKPGKVPAKPSRPSRLYLHLTDQKHLTALSDKVRQTPFQDAKNTWNSSSLLGPPSVEFAPYGRIPSAKRRTDARQATIDQDPEFIAFLESLTNPVASKPSLGESGNESQGKKVEKVTVTPLVQYLKDKKAHKGRETASPAKTAKHARSDSRDGRGDKSTDKKSPGKTILSPEQRKGTKDGKLDRAAKEAVRVLSKEVETSQRKTSKAKSAVGASTSTSSTSAGAASNPAAPTGERKRERGNASAAAKILQRDLGLNPSPGSRRRKEGGEPTKAGTEPATPSGLKASTSSAGEAASEQQVGTESSGRKKAPVTDRKEKNHTKGNAGGGGQKTPSGGFGPTAILKKSSDDVKPPTGPAGSRSSNSAKTPSTNSKGAAPTPAHPPNGTQAFLKHANPSQGITEAVLQASLETYGAVKTVEIDKKKGFAYVDFATSDGLVKAMQSSPIRVAEGQVTVVERKERGAPASGAGGSGAGAGAGGGGGGGGGGVIRGGRGEKGRGGGSGGARGGGSSSRGKPRGGGAPKGGASSQPAAPAAG
ncbi:MAG: hypothetical protein M1832_003636 [Thelocarpon impressellum]|nr:MAG: hypothetical protein M1832_003636 [Thelocarpon impressellum]